MSDILNLSGVFLDGVKRTLAPDKAKEIQKAFSPLQRAIKTASEGGKLAPAKVKFLAAHSKITDSERGAIEAGQRQWDSFVYYNRIALPTVGNDIDVWPSTNVKKTGASNLDKNILPTGYTLYIEGVSLAYGRDPGATITDVSQVPYYDFIDWPAPLRNAELTIRIGERTIIDRLPVDRVIASGVNVTKNTIDNEDAGYELRRDNVMWNSGDPITVTLHTPPGSSALMPAGNHFLQVAIAGFGTKPSN